MSNIVWRLLRRNISAGQIAGFAAANLVGLVIVLTAMQFYRDATCVIGADDNLLTADYLVLSPKVEAFGSGQGFSGEQLADLGEQPWVKRMAPFTPSRFHVSASVAMGPRMSTDLFFESIPDEFFDTLPPEWYFDPEELDPVVPIVMSRDYLALYNFGFAATRNMPQISEDMISSIPLRVSVSGNGRERTFQAQIVGFSNRLNTIAAPASFVDWANELYAAEPVADPMRMIVEVTDPGDPSLRQYLEDHDIESAGDKLNSGRAGHFFAVAAGVVIGVGALICLLSLFILMLSIYLLIQKNRQKIRDLILLGYTPAQVSKYYIRLSVITNETVLVIACVAVYFGQRIWAATVSGIGSEVTSLLPTYLVGVGIVALIVVLNVLAINRLTRRSAA